MDNKALACAALLASLQAVRAAAGTVEIAPGADLPGAVAALHPGDELVLSGGNYTLSSRFAITLAGTAAQPIVIRGKTGETASIEMTTQSQNVIDVQGSRYLVLRNLHIHGGSQGIRLIDSDFVTIEDSEVFETGDVAIAANASGSYEGLVIRRNNVHHTHGTGEGMYLGCNNDACRVLNSVIEWNHVHHTNSADVEQGDGIELKEGSAGNIIRHNVIHDTNYPGIITYATAGNGPANIIESNAIWNTNDYAIQSAADAVIRNNIVLGTISLQPHQSGSPSNQTVVHNTIVAVDSGIEVRAVSGTVVIANNAVYSQSGSAIRLISGNLGLLRFTGNVVVGGVQGASTGFENGNLTGDFVGGNFTGAPPIDLFPKSGGALIGAGTAQYVPTLDFNGMARGGAADAGAYKFQNGANPGWVLKAGFKTPSGDFVVPNAPVALRAD